MFGIDKIKKKILEKINNIDKMVNEGDIYFENKEYNKALDLYYKALEKKPLDDEIWYKMALSLYYLKDYNSSIEAVDESIKIDNKNPKYYCLRGICYYKLGCYILGDTEENLKNKEKYLNESYENLKTSYSLDKSNITVIMYLGKIHIYREEHDEAYEFFKLCYSLNKSSKCSKYYKMYHKAENIVEGLNYIEEGIYKINNKKYIEGLKYFKKYCEINNEDSFSKYYIASIYELFKDYDKALKYINESLLDNIHSGYLYYSKKGDILSKMKRYSEAIECYNKSLELNKNIYYPYLGLGILYYSIEEYEKALHYFDDLFELYTDNLPYEERNLLTIYTLISRGDLTNNMDLFKEALDYINEGISKDNENIELLNLKGYVLYKLKKYKEAMEIYHATVILDKNNIIALESLLILNLMEQNYDECIRLCDKLITINPTSKKYKEYKETIENIMFEDNPEITIEELKKIKSPLLKNIVVFHKVESIEQYIMERAIEYIYLGYPITAILLINYVIEEYVGDIDLEEILPNLKIEIYKTIEGYPSTPSDFLINLLNEVVEHIK